MCTTDGAHREYRPELLPRKGEITAWGATLFMFAAWVVLFLLQKPLPKALIFMTLFLLLCALAISLSNWVDRKTFIRLTQEGVRFENGLRRASLKWDDNRQEQVFPSAWGDKVRVLASQARFDFRTLGEVQVGGEVKGRMGFAEGQEILEQILEKAELVPTEGAGSGYYYARE
jgi:hypothetical protein